MRGFAILSAAGLLLATAATAQVSVGFGGTAYDSSQPIEVTSNSLTVAEENGLATFTGDVIIVQGDMRMAASEVSVSYSDGGNGQDVERVDATGGVLITRGADAAEGNSAIYDVSTGSLTLIGDVLVTQGRTAIAGDRMVVDLDTGNGTVDGRVRTTLRPAGDGQ